MNLLQLEKKQKHWRKLTKKVFSLLFFIFSNCTYSQEDYCTEYDSVLLKKMDTLHFLVEERCKSHLESWAIYTYKKQGKKNIPDGIFYVYGNGNLVEQGVYKDGKLTGPYLFYYPNKSIKHFALIINDSTVFETKYYSTGIIQSSGVKKNGTEIGIWTTYYENGVLKERGEYLYVAVTKNNIEEVMKILNTSGIGKSAALKNGEWYFYKQNGLLQKKEIYESGVLKKK